MKTIIFPSIYSVNCVYIRKYITNEKEEKLLATQKRQQMKN